MSTKNHRPVYLALAGAIHLACSASAMAKDYFDPGLLALTGSQDDIDLSNFETSDQVPTGDYLVSLFVNQQDRGQHSLTFSKNAKGQVQAELTPTFLKEMGVNTDALPAFANLPADTAVGDLPSLIPQSRVSFDFAQQRLDLSIPQIAMQPGEQEKIDPSLWDNGVPALLLNYNLNGGNNQQDASSGRGKSTQTNLFASFQGGINLGAWRLRSDMTYTRNRNTVPGLLASSSHNTQFSNTYVQRDIPGWRSEALLGESTTDNSVFDSFSFRGIRLHSSDDMLPSSLRGFAPVIRGIAQTNARITVSQNGNVIYQAYVPPGPFRINDLYQTGQGGDLTLTITESDGSVRKQTLAVSSLPVMRRPWSLKYDLVAGRYHGGFTEGSRESTFALATAIYGLPHDITLYGGALVAKDYLSLVVGTGLSMGVVGALSADITSSSAEIPGMSDRQNGASYRIRYAKSLLSTGTSIDLTAYRYSTSNYYSFSDVNSMNHRLKEGEVPWRLYRQRSSAQVRISQQLGNLGSLYLSGSREDYWGKNQIIKTLSAGYTGSIRGISYGLSYSIDRREGEGDWPENRQLSMNVQMPFSIFSKESSNSSAYASYQMSHNQKGQVQQQAGITGNALDDRLSYSAMQGWSNGQEDSTSSLNAGYQGSKGMISSGYSYSRHSRSLNMAANGAIVAHPEGITLSQTLGSAVAIVKAPGAGNAQVMNGNVQTDARGYAVLPYLSTYQNNSISLNPTTLPDNVDISQNSVNVFPTRGAVVMASFDTKVGYQVLLTLQRATAPVPFGATVTLLDKTASSPNTGIVGDGGQVYLSGLPEQGELGVKWGHGGDQQCRVPFNLKDIVAPTANNPIRSLKADCE